MKMKNKIKPVRKNGKKVSVILLSGGLDSCVAAVMKAEEGNEVYILSVDYESPPTQREHESRNKIINWLLNNFKNVKKHEQVKLNGYIKLRTVERGSLIPQGYPFTRDEMFILLAASWLERLLIENEDYEIGEVVIATTKEDTLNFEDIRPEVYTCIKGILDTKYCNKIKKSMLVSVPFIEMMKHEVIKKGVEIGAPLQYTWSCYFGEEQPCDNCDQCKWRKEAFKSAGAKDPLLLLAK